MSTLRRIGLLAAMPLAAVALGGAAANPTVTYHGVFDETAELSTTCPAMFTTEGWSGVWNLQLKDGVVGSPVMVQMNLKFEGRPHAVWRAAFDTVDPDAGSVWKASRTGVPWTRVMCRSGRTAPSRTPVT